MIDTAQTASASSPAPAAPPTPPSLEIEGDEYLNTVIENIREMREIFRASFEGDAS